MASVSALDLNTTDAVSVDNMAVENVDVVSVVEDNEVVSVDENADNVSSAENVDVISVVEDNEVVSVDENADNVSSAENVDELSITDDSEVLGVTRYVNPGADLWSVISSASSGDTIVLNGGSYYICDRSISKSLTIIGVNNPILTTNEHGDKCMLFIKADVTFKNLILQDARAQWGAACYVCSNCLFTVDNCTFRNNYASKGGGAILCDNGGRCKVLNSYFSSNVHSNTGGAIRIETSGEIINCTFDGCYAGGIGGAIYAFKSSMLKVINSTFIKCSSQTGGAIRIENSNQAIIDYCNFENCFANDFGGAIDVYGSPNIKILHSNFTNCYAKTYDGGAISYDSCNNINISNSYFDTCHSRIGGAVRIVKTSNNYFSDSTFIGNYARIGGAIVIGGSSDSYSKNSIINNCKFINNSASESGGAVAHREANNLKIYDSYFEGNSASDCGAVNQWYREGVIFNSTFKNNKASSNSGAVYGVILDSCKLIGNTAEGNGGAASNSVSSYCTFENNYAKGNGGSVYVTGDSISLVACNFSYSYSNIEGGSVYCKNVPNVIIDACNFLNSSSNLTGGSIFILSTTNAHLNDLYFKNSDSGNYAGSLYINDVTNINLSNTEFINSHAKMSGGAIHVNPATNLNISNCLFDGCSAEERGNSLDIGFTQNTIIKNSNFTNSNYNGNEAIAFPGSEKYEILNSIFDVAPKDIIYHYDSKISCDNLSIVQGEQCTIRATLSNLVGPISNKQVVFTVNGKNYDRTTTSDGIATFNVKDYLTGYGPQNVTVSYEGDLINNPVSQTVNVVVNRYKAVLTLDQSIRNYYGEKTISFKVADYKTGVGKAEAKIHLIIYSNGEICKTDDIYTSSNGIVTYSMAAFEPNDYTVSAYVTSENVDVNVVEGNVTISKISGKIELSSSNYNKTLNVRLVNPNNGDVYNGITVSLEFSPNGVSDTVTTDANGEASFQLREELFGVDTYTVLAKVDSSGYKEFDNVQLSNIVISTVGKDDSVVQFHNEIVFDYLENGFTTVTLEGCTISRESCSVDNHPEASILVKDNKITVWGLAAGNYTLRVKSNPDEYHNSITRTVKITVNKIDSSLTLTDPVSFNYADTGTVGVTVYGGSVIRSGVSVEGHLEAIIYVVNNQIYVSNLTVGSYTLKVTTSPDSNYKAVTRTATITVKKINSVIDFENPISFVYGGVGSVPLALDGCEVVREGCCVDNHNEAVINVDKNVVSVSNLTVGSYTLRISSTPDSNHNAVTQTIVVTVSEANSNVDISLNPIVFDYGDVGQANLILDGCSVLSDDVIIVGHDEAITRVNNNIVYVSNLTADNYTLEIRTTPDGNHKSVNKTFDVTVNKPLSSVEFIGSADFDYLGVGKTTLKLVGCTVNLDDIEVVDYPDAGISLGKGNIISIYDLDSGNYTLKVKTTPDNNHRANVAELAFTVNKINSKINFTNALVFDYLKSDFTYMTVEGADISKTMIYVDGYPDASVDLEGNKITVSGLNPGSYTLCAVTSPDDNHYSAEMNLSITVNKVYALISAPKASVYYNSGNTWSIKLYDGNTKEVLSNMQVSVKVYTGSKLYKSFTLTTNAKGIASVKVSTWTVGAHKVVVSFSKDGYTSKTVNSVVTILKTPVVITAPKFSVYLKEAKKWSIKVVDSKTKKAIANTKLTLKVYTGSKFKSYSVKTNSKGVAVFATSGLAVGTHKVVVSFSKTGYVSKSVSSSIVVKPIPLTIKGDFSYGSSGSTVRVTVTNKLTGKPVNGISVKLSIYTGSKVTKSYTLVTANYKTYKGFVGFGSNAFSVGTHNVVITPVSGMYSGQGTTSLVIKSGAAKGGTYYSFVSNGKLTLS